MENRSNREMMIWEIMEQLNVYSRISRSYNTTARTYGNDELLYQAEVHTIHYIGRNEGLSLNDLAQITQRSKGPTSTMVEALVKRGLITKRRSAEDQRRIELYLTEKGQEVFHFHEGLDAANYSAISKNASEISDEEWVNAFKVIKRVIDSMKDQYID